MIVIIVVLSIITPLAADAASVGEKTITSKGAAIIDFETGILLFGVDERTQRVPASTLKIIAVLVVYDAIKAGEISLNTTTKISSGVSAFSRNREYSNIRMAAGATLTIAQLIDFVMVRSACAATVALAEALSGSEQAFVKRMSEKALELNIRATYKDCWGGSPDNRMSPLGMALMASKLITDHPEVLQVATKQSVTYEGTTYTNTNSLLKQYTGLDGLKTGFTTPAGWCFIGTALRGGRRIIAVTMGSSTMNSRDADTRVLLDHGFAVADAVIAEHNANNNGDGDNGDGDKEEIEDIEDGGDGVIPGGIADTSSANLIIDKAEMPLTAYLINDAHYFKLRDVMYLLNGSEKQFGVESWDPETTTGTLISGLEYTVIGGELDELPASRPYMPTNSKILFDGEECAFEIYLIDGNNYFKLRDIAILMDFYVFWIDETRTVIIDTSMAYKDPAADGEELIVGYWADINPVVDDDGQTVPDRLILDGFYFAEDGSGLLFRNLEGLFGITSYSVLDGVLSLIFLNMEDEPIEWSCIILVLSENELVLGFDSGEGETTISYIRVSDIRYNDPGNYTVTMMDGTIIDVLG